MDLYEIRSRVLSFDLYRPLDIYIYPSLGITELALVQQVRPLRKA